MSTAREANCKISEPVDQVAVHGASRWSSELGVDRGQPGAVGGDQREVLGEALVEALELLGPTLVAAHARELDAEGLDTLMEDPVKLPCKQMLLLRVRWRQHAHSSRWLNRWHCH